MSSDIKSTIGVLCKLLNMLYDTNLKPEHFRLAKFNKTEENTVPILWNSLHTILDEKSKMSIQKIFCSLNYNREEFYMLTTDTKNESRELLLALVFLLSITIENDLQKKIDNGLPDIFEQFKTHKSSVHDNFNWKNLKNHDLQNYKNWLQGKTVSNNDMISEYNEHIYRIQDNYNKSLDMKAHSSLTIYEILALKNKKIGEQFLQDTEPILSMLSVYAEWIKKERQFWKWMSTVLEEAKKGP